MRRRAWRPASQSIAICMACLSASHLCAQNAFKVERIMSGLNRPVYSTFAPGDPNGLYVVQQREGGSGAALTTGSVFRYDLQTQTTTPFISLTGLDTDSQGGAHSLAFHPDYQPGVEGSKFYVAALKPSGTPGLAT